MAVFRSLGIMGRLGLPSVLWSSFQNGGRCSLNYIGVKICYLSTVVEASDFECDEIENDVKAVEKDNALRLAVSKLAGDFSQESMLSLRKFFTARRIPVISTGSLNLDLALGIGGLPKGRIVEIYGQEASGKTTLALHVIKEAQRLGGYCAYLDVENAMDPSLVESMGINAENLLVSRPDTAENLLSIVDTLVKSGSVDVIVVDSVAALLPKYELDNKIGSTTVDLQSQIITKALRKIHYTLSQSQTLIIFVNQVRSSPREGKGCGLKDEVTCGGNALGFYSSIRLRLIRMGLIEPENEIAGLGIRVQIVKNKLAPIMKKAVLGIRFGNGFCLESEVLELGCERGLISEEGGNYIIEGKILSSKHAAELYLAENHEVLEKLVKGLRRHFFE